MLVHENSIIIGDLLETHRRRTCLIGDQHASLETNMPIGDPLETNMPHRRPTRLIGDQHGSSEAKMPDPRPIGD